MTTQTVAQALAETLYRGMADDPRVCAFGSGFLLGPGIRIAALDRMREEFPERCPDLPISESAIAAMGFGAAMAGARPFIHFGRASFAFEAWSQIAGEAAVAHYTSGGQLAVPVVMHMYHGLLPIEAAQHCHSPQAMFWNTPGLEVVLPSTPQDMAGLLRTALASDNPTIILGHAKLMRIEGEVSDGEAIPFGFADIKRAGRDVTIVASSFMVHVALQAADTLAGQGIEAEIVDPRTLVPFDRKTVLDSVGKTGRIVVVDEGSLSCGVASEIAVLVAESAFDALKAPVLRLARPDVPVPFSAALQPHFAPSVEQVVEAVRRIV